MPKKIFANGVSGLTGNYILPSVEAAVVGAWAKSPPGDAAAQAQLRHLRAAKAEKHLGPPLDVDPARVEQAGWAIVFSSQERADVRAKLEPLIQHRRQLVGDDSRTKVLDYQPGESWKQWLRRHKVTAGTIEPTKVPYYLLLVGGPELIPFSLQYLLGTEYAVGRLAFDDDDEYGRYVDGLVSYETSTTTPHDASATFFGTRHVSDKATKLSADSLVAPLLKSFRPEGRFASMFSGYEFQELIGEKATKDSLREVFSGAGPSGRPGLLFTATHGMGGWPSGHPDQKARHGALLCQDWPGVGHISEAHYFSAADLPPDAHVHGLVAFFFACFGAGTPARDAFAHKSGEPPAQLAPTAFVSALPKSLLSHPQGGALAVIGHVDRAWGYSFVSGGEEQLLPFQNALGLVLLGKPVGFAMKDFGQRFAVLSASLSGMLEEIGFGDLPIPDADLARAWTERNDAQNFVVLGDPAVALKVG